jgi:hypothetical protein
MELESWQAGVDGLNPAKTARDREVNGEPPRPLRD